MTPVGSVNGVVVVVVVVSVLLVPVVVEVPVVSSRISAGAVEATANAETSPASATRIVSESFAIIFDFIRQENAASADRC